MTEPERPELAKGEAQRMPYSDYLEERRRLIEARQRAEQRTDHLVTTGAAGALVLSITFLENIAPAPVATSRPFLIAAWAILLVCLALNLASTIISRRAFDDAVDTFDRVFLEGEPGSAHSVASTLTGYLGWASAIAFVVGIALLAWFALLNVDFTAMG